MTFAFDLFLWVSCIGIGTYIALEPLWRNRMSKAADPFKAANARQLRCPECHVWVPCQRGRLKLDNHIESAHPEAWARQLAVRSEFE